LLDKFRGFLEYSNEEFEDLWGNAFFVVDTNVLINFYRYTNKETTKSLFNILLKLKETGRFWIPHQVALEYFFNYENNMNKQKEGYETLGKEFLELKDVAKRKIKEIQGQHPYIHTENFQFLIDRQEESNSLLRVKLDEEIQKLPDSEVIKNDLLDLLNESIGDAFPQDRIDEIEERGIDRYANDVPPGFEDKKEKNKQSFRVYGGVKYQRLYGDLIVWEQMIARAMQVKKPVIFITEEKKEDWWEKESGKIKRPHPHLIQEFLDKAKVNFYMYRTDTFLKYAQDFIYPEVTDEQVETVRQEVETLRKVDDQKEHIKVVDIDIGKVLEYLNNNQKQHFNSLIERAYDPEAVLPNILYNQAIKWALNVSLPIMERNFQELMELMISHNHGYAELAMDGYTNLPDDLDNRVIGLLEIISFLKENIGWYESQGY